MEAVNNYKTLTKTDFKFFLDCPESYWLLKNKPNLYPKGEFSLFAEKLVKEGYEVEFYAKKLFNQGIDLPEHSSPEDTLIEINKGYQVYFQPSFLTDQNIFARIDILKRKIDGTWHIYEVKSSTSVKKDRKHRQIEDTCFQKYVMQSCGFEVSSTSIIHLNKDYMRSGTIDPFELLEISDITDSVENIYSSVVNKIKAASNFIHKERINENVCSCLKKTRSNHCDAFGYFNSHVPENNIYEVKRISAKKVESLVVFNQFGILDIPYGFELNLSQQLQIESLRQEKPIINRNNIQREFEKLKYPLHFVDYETYASAIPRIDGVRPHQHLPFQVSIHTLQKDGEVTHFEYLLDEMRMPEEMVKEMNEFSGLRGTYVSWHASFEIGRNKDMMKWFPQYSTFLRYMNDHMFDLENIFKKDYIDYRFKGSSSIKKVLPILCPNINYSSLEVNNGTMALDTWGRMVIDENFDEDIQKTKKNLLEYCKLDTLAMVEIYRYLVRSYG